MIVDKARSKRLPWQTYAFLRGADFQDPPVFDRYTDAAPRTSGVEDQIREQGVPHGVRREAKRPGGKPLQDPPENRSLKAEASSIRHGHLNPQTPGRCSGGLVTSVGVTDDAYAGVVEKHVL